MNRLAKSILPCMRKKGRRPYPDSLQSVVVEFLGNDHKKNGEAKMVRVFGILCLTIELILLIPTQSFTASEKKFEEWKGRYANGKPLTRAALDEILENHSLWISGGMKEDDERRADLREADLKGVDLWRADLSGAKLGKADLTGAKLEGATLTKAYLWSTTLKKASLMWANLNEASLSDADLTKAELIGAKLFGADLRQADLSGCRLNGADLRRADLTGTKLDNAEMEEASLNGVTYEPKPGFLPNVASIAQASDLDEISYSSRHGLVELRNAFKDKGLRMQEQKVTRMLLQKKEEGAKGLEWFFYFVLKVTCDYGAKPFRPIKGLFTIFVFFSIFYMGICRFSRKRKKCATVERRAGIWKVWLDDRIMDRERGRFERVPSEGFWPIWFGVYFSILSTFDIGWRDLNVRSWLARVNHREYVLKATGWVRLLSGSQSLLSVVLLVLFILTYFGSPFNNL